MSNQVQNSKFKIFCLLSSTFVFLLLFFPSAAIAEITPNDPEFSRQWYLQSIKAPEAWDKTTGSSRVVVAVLDSGIEAAHPDLMENIWTNPDEIPFNSIDDDHNGYVDDVHGWDFLKNQPNPGPDFSASSTKEGFHHGTLIAGLIGATGNNGTDGVGVNWRVQIMPLKVLNERGEGEAKPVIPAIDYAIKEGAQIINLSMISDPGKTLADDFLRVVQRAHEAGIVIVAAAGNDAGGSDLVGGDLDFNPRFPVCYDGPQGEPWWVIGVAALDKNDRKADFSDYGLRCVDIAAPGVKMSNLLVYHPGRSGFEKSFDGNWSGTSLAAPLVSGAAALIKSMRPDFGPKEIYEVLAKSADNIDDKNPFYLRQLGAGKLNLAKAMELVEQISQETLLKSKARFLISSLSGKSPRLYDSKGRELEAGLIQSLAYFLDKKAVSADVQSVLIDIDHDGKDEIVKTEFKAGQWRVKISTADGLLKKSFLTYNREKKIVFSVADVNGDGQKEIVTVPLANNPILRIWTAHGKKLRGFIIKGNFNKGIGLKIINL